MNNTRQKFFTRIGMLTLVAFLLLPLTAFAQDNGRWRGNNTWRRDTQYEQNRRGRNWDRYGRFGGSFQLRQTALNAGYNNGIQEGRKDRSRGDRFDYRDEGDFQKATEDYSSRLGDKELYKRYFREGFANGYEDGYRGY